MSPIRSTLAVQSRFLSTDRAQWLAANMVVSSFAIGVLGKSVFGLGFVDAILVDIFFNLLGVMTVCFFSCFGPPFGLRQMVLSRFWFGWWGTKFSEHLYLSTASTVLGSRYSHALLSLQLRFSMCYPAWAGPRPIRSSVLSSSML